MQASGMKLTSTVLQNLFTNLNLLSSIDYKIKLNQWVDQAKRHIPGLTDSDAQVYFLTYRALLEEVDIAGGSSSMPSSTAGPKKE
jgi:hypothetical protein